MRWASRSERQRRRDLARARWHERFCWWPTAVQDKTVWLETVMQRRVHCSWVRVDMESRVLTVLAEDADAMEKLYADDLNTQMFHASNLLSNSNGEKWAQCLKKFYSTKK